MFGFDGLTEPIQPNLEHFVWFRFEHVQNLAVASVMSKHPQTLQKNIILSDVSASGPSGPHLYLAAAGHKKSGHLNLDVGLSSSHCEMITYRFIFRCSASGLPCKISRSLN
jgi:hypothetical protein